MSLNIKNERTHALVRELAERTGQSQTSAVEEAVDLGLGPLPGRRGAWARAVAGVLESVTGPVVTGRGAAGGAR